MVSSSDDKTVKVCKKVCKQVSITKKSPKEAKPVKKAKPVKGPKKPVKEVRKTVKGPKKPVKGPKKPVKEVRKIVKDSKKSSRDSKKSSKATSTVSAKTKNNSVNVNVNQDAKITKKSKMKNKLLAAIAAAGLLGIGYLKVIAPIIEKSRIAKEEAEAAILSAKTDGERRIAEEELLKRENILQMQEIAGAEIQEERSSVSQEQQGPSESLEQREMRESLPAPRLDPTRRREIYSREENLRNQEVIKELKRDFYKKNLANAIEIANQKAEYYRDFQRRKSLSFQESLLNKNQARELAGQKAEQIRRFSVEKAEEFKRISGERALYAKQKAEESKRISNQKAEEMKQKAEEMKQKAEEIKKKAEESKRISMQKSLEFRQRLNSKVQEFKKRFTGNSVGRQSSLPGYTSTVGTPVALSAPNTTRTLSAPGQLPQGVILDDIKEAEASGLAVSEAAENAISIGSVLSARPPKLIIPITSSPLASSPVASTSFAIETPLPSTVFSSPISSIVLPPIKTQQRSRSEREEMRRAKKNSAINSQACSVAEEQELRSKSRKLSFGSNNFSNKIQECSAPDIKGISIDGEYFECISGPSGIQEMKDDYLESINNLIIKAKVCSDKRIKNENTIYFEKIRNASAKTKNY
jgi:small subunit ribosomal protein S3